MGGPESQYGNDDAELKTTRGILSARCSDRRNGAAGKKKAAVFRGLFICSGHTYMRFAAAGGKV
jgi:hypothetical protein